MATKGWSGGVEDDVGADEPTAPRHPHSTPPVQGFHWAGMRHLCHGNLNLPANRWRHVSSVVAHVCAPPNVDRPFFHDSTGRWYTERGVSRQRGGFHPQRRRSSSSVIQVHQVDNGVNGDNIRVH
ncbi:hypothetical protein H310_12660, partial [Aphanomyces invadans]